MVGPGGATERESPLQLVTPGESEQYPVQWSLSVRLSLSKALLMKGVRRERVTLLSKKGTQKNRFGGESNGFDFEHVEL